MSEQSTPAPATGASGKTRTEWMRHLAEIGADHGFFERIGADHLALFVQEGETLLVSFDTADRVFAEAEDGLPQGFEAVQRREWSLLSVLGRADSLFRDADLLAFFDGLRDQGFFNSFEEVIFLGHGPACGHAACAFAAAAPGAKVLATSPAASMDPDWTGFDARLRPARRGDVTRYGDGASLVGTAAAVVVIFDPSDPLSAAHAAQFRGPNIIRAPQRFAGPDLRPMIEKGGVSVPLLRALANGRLDRARVAELMRPARRHHMPYLWQLMKRAEAAGQFDRAYQIADYAAAATGDDRFERRAEELRPGAVTRTSEPTGT